MKDFEEEKNQPTKLDRYSEGYGIVRSLKWVRFLMTYKHKDSLKDEIDSFIKAEENRYPELKNEERY